MAETFKNESLARAFVSGLEGKHALLFAELERVSGLPGTRINTRVATAFADECGRAGERADGLIDVMLNLDAERAPGGTPHEFLPVCAVYALGARGASDEKRRTYALTGLHQAAEDLRFRVRDAVSIALARIGALDGDRLATELAPWMESYFQAAAVLCAFAQPPFANALGGPVAITRLDDALALLYGAARSDRRYPGHKALCDAVVVAAGPLAGRLGAPVLDALAPWATKNDPPLRELIVRSVQNAKIKDRHAAEARGIEAAADAAKPVPRDGKKLVPRNTRRRAKR